ncbi:MAG: IS5 family transposase [Pseudonocardiaceae bacterium]
MRGFPPRRICDSSSLPRGRRGAHRVDDRRVISGIMHMLRSGARWRDCPAEYGPYTTIYNRFNRWSRQGIWLAMFEALTGNTGVIGTAAIDSSHVKAHRSAAGGKGGPSEAIGRSRGGRTTKLHALTDAAGRPRVLLITPGNLHDVVMAPELLRAAGPIERLIADKAYDTNKLRRLLLERRTEAVIPSIARRKPLIPYDPEAYRQRNLIERMFGRLKDFRRIATRYDKLARNFLASIVLAATITWWT